MSRFGIIVLLGILSVAGGFDGSALGQTRPSGGQRSNLQLDFEDRQIHWRVATPTLASNLTSQENTDVDRHGGKRCERLIFKSSQYAEEQRLVLDVAPARAIEELKASLWFRASFPEARLSLRLRLPHQIDPRTGQPLSLELPGSRYTEANRWQQLECETTEAAINRQLILARAQFASQGNRIQIDTREMYVDQISLVFPLRQGETGLQIDDVSYGPIVRPGDLVLTPEPTSHGRVRLKAFNDRILKDDQPFFPVFTLYHGESINDIKSTGVNMLWIPDYADRAILKALDEVDIGAIAQPPQLTPEEAVLKRKGLPTFPDWTDSIWAWMFGHEIPADDVRYIKSWVEQVRDADRQMRRPVLADVVGNERAIHRTVDLLGSSQFVMHTAISAPLHAKQLKHRRNLALPGKPMFTHIQTEASSAYLDHRGEGQTLPIVEPEQILHQGYAALAAGFKGVGFWKHIPLDSDIPGLNERVHAIRLFALHCQVLQPWLATGRVVDDLPIRLDSEDQRQQTGILAPLKSRWDTPVQRVGAILNAKQTEILATVIRSDDGLLILPVWYEENEQCVPGPQVAKGIRMLLKGDIWQAWEVTPVGVTQSNLEVSWPAGGTEIHLKEFDQQSTIIITSKPSVVEQLQRDCRQIRDDAARSMVSLASLKFKRVQDVHNELVSLNQTVPQAELSLRQAYSYLETASKELDASHPVEAYTAARKCLQHLRILQRRYWEAATADLPSVVTSMDATNFQTLPDYWRMIKDLGTRTRTSPNLIPTGDFESLDAMYDPEHGPWSNGSSSTGKKRIQLQHDRTRNDHYLSLQLESTPGENATAVLVSPEVSVIAGDLVVITAQVRVTRPFITADDGFLIFDTLVGSQGAVWFNESKSDWQTVKIVRRISRDSRFRVRLELRGNGAVDVDGLRVHRLLP